jgi:hypothetical protein
LETTRTEEGTNAKKLSSMYGLLRSRVDIDRLNGNKKNGQRGMI